MIVRDLKDKIIVQLVQQVDSPSRVLKHVPQDGVRGLGVVVAHPDVGPPDLVLLDDVLDALDHLGLAFNQVEKKALVILLRIFFPIPPT